jgi:hypothetical protein
MSKRLPGISVGEARPGKARERQEVAGGEGKGEVMRDQRPMARKRKFPDIFSRPANSSFLSSSTTNSIPKDNEVTLHNVTSTLTHTIPSSRIMPQAIAEL